MKHQLTLLFSFFTLLAAAQKREEIFDYQFKPIDKGGYYFVVTEKQDAAWKRKAWFLSQRTLYMDGSYKDEGCTVAHGLFTWYHTNGYLRTTGNYVDGYREGVFLDYNEQGALKDSTTYVRGRKSGVGLSFFDNGYLSDSTNFDGAGNGIQVRWHEDGAVAAAGHWMQDTLKKGRWKYFHRNGAVMATEDYDANGKMVRCDCYDDKGTQLDATRCKEQEASVDAAGWKRFLHSQLGSMIDQKAREGISGTFSVILRFIVDVDGTVKDIRPMTNYGHGIEEDIVKIFRKAPQWKPAMQYGRQVRSYHLQPVTFEIAEQ